MSVPPDWIDTPVTPLFLPDLKNKTALITGSSQGIGKATTELLLQNGVRVFGLSLQRGDLKHPNLTEL